MAIKAGLVGVNPKGIDNNGMPIGPKDSVSEAQLTANGKQFHFAYDETSEKYGYKLDGAGDFIPFESAGGGPGWVKPADPKSDMTLSSGITLKSGGYAEDDENVYVDMVVEVTTKVNAIISNLPGTAITGSKYFSLIKGTDESIGDVYYGTNSNTIFLSPGASSSSLTCTSSYINVGDFIHFVAQYPKA